MTTTSENNNSIEKIINNAANKFGRINLSSGNCGNFSLALAKTLKEKGFSPEIGLLYAYYNGEDFDSVDDLAASEPKIYHVVVLCNDKIYDGTGEITTEDLVDFSIREYGDHQPMFMTDINADEIALETIVNFETDWSITKEQFFDSFKQNNNVKKRNKRKFR